MLCYCGVYMSVCEMAQTCYLPIMLMQNQTVVLQLPERSKLMLQESHYALHLLDIAGSLCVAKLCG